MCCFCTSGAGGAFSARGGGGGAGGRGRDQVGFVAFGAATMFSGCTSSLSICVSCVDTAGTTHYRLTLRVCAVCLFVILCRSEIPLLSYSYRTTNSSTILIVEKCFAVSVAPGLSTVLLAVLLFRTTCIYISHITFSYRVVCCASVIGSSCVFPTRQMPPPAVHPPPPHPQCTKSALRAALMMTPPR